MIKYLNLICGFVFTWILVFSCLQFLYSWMVIHLIQNLWLRLCNFNHIQSQGSSFNYVFFSMALINRLQYLCFFSYNTWLKNTLSLDELSIFELNIIVIIVRDAMEPLPFLILYLALEGHMLGNDIL